MPKLFAVILPIVAIVATMFSILLVEKNSEEHSKKKATPLVIGAGLLIVIVGIILFIRYL